MKPNFVLKVKRMTWVAAGEIALILVLLFIATHSGAQAQTTAAAGVGSRGCACGRERHSDLR